MTRSKYVEKRRLEFETRFRVINAFPGNWESIFRGEGEDFSEIRKYQPEDDFRKIYWPLVAKTNSYMVRENIALKDLKILVALDLSPSMGFHLKPGMIDLFTGLVGSLAARSSIPFGFFGSNGDTQYFSTIRTGWDHLDDILEWLLDYDFAASGHETDFTEYADFILEHLPRHSVVFILSDFSEEIDTEEFRILSDHYDSIAVVIRDPLEIAFPSLRGEFSFKNFDGKTNRVWLTPKRVERLNREMQEDLARTIETLQRFDTDVMLVDSPEAEEAYERLSEFFQLRRSRRHQ